MIKMLGSERNFAYLPLPRVGVGMPHPGTSEAVAVGIDAFALQSARLPVTLPSIQSIPP